MKLVLYIFLSLSMAAWMANGLPRYQREASATDLFIDQQLDHFNPQVNKTWKQRYWLDDQYFDKQHGPVFLMIGGESELNDKWYEQGPWIDYAKQSKALILALEIRYYGQSQPTADLSTHYLEFLNTKQALADIVAFRNFIHTSKSLDDTANRWISFGGGYAGSLSAWLRLKSPQLVYGAISSSAPIKAQVDFSDYNIGFMQTIQSTYGSSCLDAITNATVLMQELMFRNRSLIETKFKTCSSLKDDSITLFYSIIFGFLQQSVEESNEKPFGAAMNITNVCNVMTNSSLGNVIDRLSILANSYLALELQVCLHTDYNDYIADLSNPSWPSAMSGRRQWMYQQCTELGFFQTTSSTQQPFGQTMPFGFFSQICQDLFSSVYSYGRLVSNAAAINGEYGAYSYTGSNVVFVNGNLDPWRTLGFRNEAPNANTSTVYIGGEGHCADMRPSDPKMDSPSLIKARKSISDHIAKWLSQ